MRRTVVRPRRTEAKEEPEVRRPDNAILALQRSAGNHAVTRLLQRAPVGYVVGNPGGKHFDSHLGAEVEVQKELPGLENDRPWLVLREHATEITWLWQPASGLLEEKYSHYHPSSYPAELVAAKVKKAEAEVGAKLESTPWTPSADTKTRTARTDKERAILTNELNQGIAAWNEYEQLVLRRANLLGSADAMAQGFRVVTITARVNATFRRLIWSLDPASGRQPIEYTGELANQVHKVTGPPLDAKRIKQPKDADAPPLVLSEKTEVEAGQHLAELDWAVTVAFEQKLAEPLVLGAQGRMLPPGMAKLPPPESAHGGLPPLNVLDLEADAYYLTQDGVLHLDEVKDTPNAMAAKLKEGEQIGRHIQWMLKEVMNPDTKQPRVKQVGYFCRAGHPKFDGVLSDAVIANLELLGQLQPGVPYINIAGEPFTPAQLRVLYDAAIDWLKKSRPALEQNTALHKVDKPKPYDPFAKKEDEGAKKDEGPVSKVDNSLVFKEYFDSLWQARLTLGKGPLPWPDDKEAK